MLFCSLSLRVTVWPNLFFWACHGKAAHPANMPDEVWSLHPNPALLPSAHIPAQLSSLPEVDVTHRHRLRGQMEASLSVPETSEADHDISPHSYVLTWGCWLSLRSWEKLDRAYVAFMVFLFSWTKRTSSHHQWWWNQLVQGNARREGRQFGRIMLNYFMFDKAVFFNGWLIYLESKTPDLPWALS